MTSSRLPLPCAFLVKLLNEIKIYHWTTTVFARHETTDKLHEKLQSAVDKFVEMYLASSKSDPSSINNGNFNGNVNSSFRTNGQIESNNSTTFGSLATASDKFPFVSIEPPNDATYPDLLKDAIRTLTSGIVGKMIQKNVALTARRDSIVEHLQIALYLSRME